MNVFNAAIIGCGSIHVRHYQAIENNPAVRLAAIVDTDKYKAETLAEKYRCRAYLDYREMLADPDIQVVHICTPHHCHKTMIIDALLAGKHVFAEKPVALNSAQAAEIKAVLSRVDRRLGVCYQNRLNSTSLKIKAVLDSGQLGAMKGIKAILSWSRNDEYYLNSDWRGKFSTEGGGLLINQAIHTLDLMQWFGGGVTRLKGVVDASFLAHATEAEDSAMVSLELANGARGLFYGTNCATQNSPLQLDIHCERGWLSLTGNQLWLHAADENTCLATDQPDKNAAKAYWGNGHDKMIDNFYAALSCQPSENIVDISAAEKSLAIVDAIYRSAEMRSWITL